MASILGTVFVFQFMIIQASLIMKKLVYLQVSLKGGLAKNAIKGLCRVSRRQVWLVGGIYGCG